MYLVDTDVLSSGAPAAGRRPPEFAEWMEAHSAELFLSAVTVAEIASGIAKVARTGRTGRANDLKAWLALVLHLYGDRVMPFDVAAAQVAGALLDRARSVGHTPEFADVAIAATAESRGLTVLTRNLRHFTPLGVTAVDPFENLP